MIANQDKTISDRDTSYLSFLPLLSFPPVLNNTNSISTPTPDISSTTSGSDTSTDLATNIHKITPHNTNQRNTSTRDEQWLRYDDVYNALQVQKDRGKDWSFLDRLLSSPPFGNYLDEESFHPFCG